MFDLLYLIKLNQREGGFLHICFETYRILFILFLMWIRIMKKSEDFSLEDPVNTLTVHCLLVFCNLVQASEGYGNYLCNFTSFLKAGFNRNGYTINTFRAIIPEYQET